jgi:hypothetical protein
MSLIFFWLFCNFCDFICSTTTVEVLETTYKTEGTFIIGPYLGLPQNGQIENILIHQSEVYFVLEVLNTLQFCHHYYGYVVVASTNKEWKIL